MESKTAKPSPILVTCATGKTGRRICQRLIEKGHLVRAVSRQSATRFDWNDPGTWDAALTGVSTVYLCYSPDLAVPGAEATVRAFVDRAVASGIKRFVLLSGRGEAVAQKCEKIIQRPGIEWTIVRASWFSQNFSEGAFTEMIAAGEVALPAGDIGEPFIDVEDIADVAVVALTEDGHSGQIYELTGPRLLTFAQAVAEIASSTGRSIRFIQIPHEAFVAGLGQAGLPPEMVDLIAYLFSTVLDGRNARVCDGVQRALGRDASDFSEYARRIAASQVSQLG